MGADAYLLVLLTSSGVFRRHEPSVDLRNKNSDDLQLDDGMYSLNLKGVADNSVVVAGYFS